jgi:AhpC/TSA antioxidant enzyme
MEIKNDLNLEKERGYDTGIPRSCSAMLYSQFQALQRQRVSDGTIAPVLSGITHPDGTKPDVTKPGVKKRVLVLVWSQLGDFDTVEYAMWLKREAEWLSQQSLEIRAIAIGNLTSGKQFCDYTGFPEEHLFLDPTAEIHAELGLYPGLTMKLPGVSDTGNAWVNLLLMCAGIGSPGTLKEVFRGYLGDRNAPQLINPDEVVQATPLPAIKGSFFDRAGGSGFQRPFELATLRLKNMTQVLGNWKTYVPDARYMTQRGGTFLFELDGMDGRLVYEHRDRGILGFAENMSRPLSFLDGAFLNDSREDA